MNGSIERLAHAVDKDWALAGRAKQALPEIAVSHLKALQLDVDALIDDLCLARALPPQRLIDQSFGQPQVTIHAADQFEIEVLFWRDGTPAIHQHAFDGAFCLLAGRSAHCRYQFEPCGRIDRVTFGRLHMADFAVLEAGHPIEIPHGDRLIHSAFHIDSPSITLVVRTSQDQTPELTYLPPGVSYDTADRSASLHKKLQLLDTLAATQHSGYAEAVEATITAGDVYDGLAVLVRTGAHAIADPIFDKFAGRLREQHGNRDGIAIIVQAAYAERRRIRLVQSRKAMTDRDSRVLLAMLLCFDDRDAVLAAISEYAGNVQAAIDLIAAGVGRLFGVDADRELLARTAARVKLAGHAEAAFVQAIATIQDSTLSDEEETGLHRFYRQVTGHWLVAPLFDEPKNGVQAIVR
jgi:hypothetical protein